MHCSSTHFCSIDENMSAAQNGHFLIMMHLTADGLRNKCHSCLIRCEHFLYFDSLSFANVGTQYLSLFITKYDVVDEKRFP